MRTLIIPITLLALAGCSDPKAASEKNFKVAVQGYLDKAYPNCYFKQNFPAFKSDFDFNRSNATLAAFEKAGLLSTSEVQQQEKAMFGPGSHTVTKVSYDLTEEGKKYYKQGIAKNLRGESVGGFCAGKATVKSVDQFSEPADMMGMRVSRVDYQYSVTELPKWTSVPEIQAVIPGLKADVDSPSHPVKKTDAMILTSNGWVHEKLFSR